MLYKKKNCEVFIFALYNCTCQTLRLIFSSAKLLDRCQLRSNVVIVINSKDERSAIVTSKKKQNSKIGYFMFMRSCRYTKLLEKIKTAKGYNCRKYRPVSSMVNMRPQTKPKTHMQPQVSQYKK